MKRMRILFFLAAALLTAPVCADFGPKPQLIFRAESGPGLEILAYAVQFLATFLPALAIEGLLLLMFRLWTKRNAWFFLGINVVTQGGLALWMSVRTIREGPLWAEMILETLSYAIRYLNMRDLLRQLEGPAFFWLLPGEVLLALAEAGMYIDCFRDRPKTRTFLYALAANYSSFLISLYLAEPVWRLAAGAM